MGSLLGSMATGRLGSLLFFSFSSCSSLSLEMGAYGV
jgi:hypothetical protein